MRSINSLLSMNCVESSRMESNNAIKFNALTRNQIWKLISRSINDQIINTKWVFKVSKRQDGLVEHYKVRWIANRMR